MGGHNILQLSFFLVITSFYNLTSVFAYTGLEMTLAELFTVLAEHYANIGLYYSMNCDLIVSKLCSYTG